MPPLGDADQDAVQLTAEDGLAQFAGAYAAFYEGVANRQVSEWLPSLPSRVLDLSGADGHYAVEVARRGHTVVHMTGPDSKRPCPQPGLHVVQAGVHDLRWLRAAAFDAVLAECSVLSSCLAFEDSLAWIRRALRPGGRVLLSLDSLSLGLARLAGQGRWAELADVPAADVVLVPAVDGQITRCFWPEEVAEVLADCGFHTEWIRPRTVLAPEAVNRALAADPSRLDTLVATEMHLEHERAGDGAGYHLVAAAVRR